MAVQELTVEMTSVGEKNQNPEEIRQVIRFVHEHISELSPPLKRDLIRRLIVHVKLGKDQIEVGLNPSGLLAQVAEIKPLKMQQANSTPASFGLSPVRLLSNLGSQAPPMSQSVSAIKTILFSGIRDLPLFKIKSFLQQKYLVEMLSPAQIGAEFFSARSTIVKYLKQHEIPLRPADQESTRRRFPAFGQKRHGIALAIHKREQELIAKMQKLRAEGLSYWKIADVLNAWNIPTKTRKGRWSSKQVHQILKRVEKCDSGCSPSEEPKIA